jgi:hypothetical protein
MLPKSVPAAAAQASASPKSPTTVIRALGRAVSPYFNLRGSVLAVTGVGWNGIPSTLLVHHVPVAAGHSIGDGDRVTPMTRKINPDFIRNIRD